jgi:formylglycine-generating enzyme required for sulfatase activity
MLTQIGAIVVIGFATGVVTLAAPEQVEPAKEGPAGSTKNAPAVEANPEDDAPPEFEPPGALVRDGYVNSLGVPFKTVTDTNVFFSAWLTRVQDFEAFAKATELKSDKWKALKFKQEANHPVVNVSWEEAVGFCAWLTVVEQKKGTLPMNRAYRLPTDLEWSAAVGLTDETGATPEKRDLGVAGVYPWGKVWPPPAGSGNYTGTETGSGVAIKGYNDGFVWTSPVGSFRANRFGLFDMGGNAWQWTNDRWSANSNSKVLRGGSWYNGALKLSLLSSCRVHAAPGSAMDNYGFRVVIERVEAGAAEEKK